MTKNAVDFLEERGFETISAWNKGRGANKNLYRTIIELIEKEHLEVICEDKSLKGYHKLTVRKRK